MKTTIQEDNGWRNQTRYSENILELISNITNLLTTIEQITKNKNTKYIQMLDMSFDSAQNAEAFFVFKIESHLLFRKELEYENISHAINHAPIWPAQYVALHNPAHKSQAAGIV